MAWQILFWISVFTLFYAYVAYPILLKLFAREKPTISTPGICNFPPLTILIAAYNEEQCIEQKIQNCLSLHYPAELLKVMVVDDGSEDRTASLVQQYPGVTLLRHQKRSGKSAALNTGMEAVNTPFVIFSDANCLLKQDALTQLIPFFEDDSVGGVAGQKRLHVWAQHSDAANAEAGYWHYESRVKQLESSFYTLAGATGELLAIRTELFRPIPSTIITDDFYISMQLQSAGKKLVYAHHAIAEERASPGLADEWRRKKRISAGAFQSLNHFAGHLNPLRDLRFAFQFFSHRVLRWVCCAPALLLFFISGGFLFFAQVHPFYEIIFYLQLLFLAVSLIALRGYRTSAGFVFSLPFYFLFMHAAMIAGFLAFITGKQTVFWNKASR